MVTPMVALIAFLRARLDEDEAIANAGDVSRIHREVAAKRAILDRHCVIPGLRDVEWCMHCTDDTSWTTWPCGDVRAIAAVYGGHHDYRPEWAPE